MKQLMSGLCSMFLLFIIFSNNVFCAVYSMDFSVSDLRELSDVPAPSPYSSISGSILFEAATLNSQIDSVTSVNLTIGNKVYGPSDIGYTDVGEGMLYQYFGGIGGSAGPLGSPDPGGMNSGTDDFVLAWYPTEPANPLYFGYTTSSVAGGWFTNRFDTFRITEVAPVEPQRYGLFIGVNSFWQRNADDAKAFKDKLVSTNILKEENTKLLTSNFNCYDIFSAINSFDLQANDTLYFYYSGHGGQVTYASGKDGGETTKTPNDEYITWGDGPYDDITDDALAAFLNDFNDVNKWVFLDSCNSAGIWGNGKEGDGDLDILNNIALIAATSENWNAGSGLDGRGFMTNALIDGLGYTRDGFLVADDDKNGVIALSEWDKYLNKKDWWVPLFGTYVYEKNYGDLVVFNEHMVDFQVCSSADFFSLMEPLTPLNPVPEPATILLLCTGLAGLAWHLRRQKK